MTPVSPTWPPRLGVEGRAVEEHRRSPSSAGTTASTVALASTPRGPTNSVGPCSSRISLEASAVGVDVALLARLLGAAAALLGHGRVEAVDGRPPTPRSAAISWVTSSGKPKVSWSLKATSPGQAWPARARRGSSSSVDAAAQRLAEALLLPLDDAGDEVAVAAQLGVGVAHDVDARVDQRRQ